MRDPWNPRKHELRVWAYDPEASWPDQDFDLSVAELCFSELILEFANDDSCPKKEFFLSCAYILIGDAVMTEYGFRTKEDVEGFLIEVNAIKNERMSLLYNRAIELMNNPPSFDYDLWCGEGYVNQQS